MLAPGISAVAAFAVIIFVGSVPLEYSLILPGVGSITRVIGIVMFLAVVVDVVLSGRVRETSAVFVILLVFVLWATASISWSFEPQLSIERSATYLQLFLMTWVMWQYLRTDRDVQRAMQAFVAGALIVAVVTIRDFRAINLAALVVTDLRVSAFGQNPNEAGLLLVVALPFALLLQRSSSAGWLRIANGAYLVLGSVAAVLTASRGAVVALAVCGTMMLMLMHSRRRSIRTLFWMLGVVTIAIGVAATLVPDIIWSRIGAIVSMLQRMDFNNRMENWLAGLSAFSQHPLVGVGAGAFEGATAHLIAVPRSSHSTWLGVVVETGVIGAVLWFSAITFMVLRLWRAEDAVRRALLSSVVSMAIGMMILGWDHRKIPWLVFAFCLCAGFTRESRDTLPSVVVDPAAK